MLAFGLMCGCAHSGSAPVPESRIAGTYISRDLFWTRTLRLEADRTFSFYQLSTSSRKSRDEAAQIRLDENWGVSGRWVFHPPDRLEFVSAQRTSRTSIRVRVDPAGRVELDGLDSLPGILKAWHVAGSADAPHPKP